MFCCHVKGQSKKMQCVSDVAKKTIKSKECFYFCYDSLMKLKNIAKIL